MPCLSQSPARCLRTVMMCLLCAASTRAPLAQQMLAPPAATKAPEAAKGALPADAVAEPTLQRARRSGVIKVGARTDSVPFSYWEGGKPVGYGIEMCTAALTQLKRDLKMSAVKMEFVPVTAANRFQALKSGQIDIECGSTTNNIERRREVLFALPYFFAGPQILARRETGIAEFKDLTGRKVAVIKGSNSVELLQQRLKSGALPGLQMVETPTNDAAFGLLERGEVDAVVQIDVLLASYYAKSGRPAQLRIVGRPMLYEPIAPVMRPGDAEFKKEFDKRLADLMLDGAAEKIYRKWFMESLAIYNASMDMPLSPALRDQFRFPTSRVGDEVVLN